jgi:hypothetical protein
MAGVRVRELPGDRVAVALAVDRPAWVRRLPQGLWLALVSVLIPGCAARWL